MPNTKSAKKRLKQNVARRIHNRAVRSALKTHVRKVRDAIRGGDAEAAQTLFRFTAKKLDQAGARNIIHRNAAARLKSRLSGHIKAMKQPAASGQ